MKKGALKRVLTPVIAMGITSVFILVIISLQSINSKQSEQLKQSKERIEELEKTRLIKKSESFPYQTKYPELDVNDTAPKNWKVEEGKNIYLTFDDGPTSVVTNQVLDILKEKDVKATFFVVGTQLDNPENHVVLKRIAEEGHVVAIHTNSHDYLDIYSSVDAYLDDFQAVWKKVFDITGIKANVFRFPGGSVNAYNGLVYQEIIAEMTRRGFMYYDWNASSGDAQVGRVTKQDIIDSSVATINKDKVVLLMHDTNDKHATVHALPTIIDIYKNNGFNFGVLTNDINPIIFTYNK